MFKKTISYAVLFSAVLLTGCNNEYEAPKNSSLHSSNVNSSSLNSNNQTYQPTYESAEDKELKEILAKMKAQDPSIVDAYFSVDENGEKMLNLVKKDENAPVDNVAGTGSNSSSSEGSGSSALSTFMWSMAGGFAASMLYDSFTKNKGNMSAVTSQYKPSATGRSSFAAYNATKQASVKNYQAYQNKLAPVKSPNSLNSTQKLKPVDATKKVQPLSQDAYRNQPYKTQVVKQKPTTSAASNYVKPKPAQKQRSFGFGRSKRR